MLEVGWSEILVIALILIIVVGPKDLPQMLRTFGKMATRLRGMANEFKGQFDEALKEADLDDVRKGLNEVKSLNPASSLRDAMNPIRKLGEDIKSDLKKASDMSPSSATPVVETSAPSAVEPLAGPIGPTANEKIAEPEPIAQPMIPNVVETPAKPKATRKQVNEPVAAAVETPVAVTAEAKTKKAPVRTKDAAVAAVAAETAARKPISRKKADASESSMTLASTDVIKPKRAAPRKKTTEPGDA